MGSAAGGYIGQAKPRVEDRPLLTGRGRYVADIAPPGVLDVAFLRSGLAHAVIVELELGAASSAPGVVLALGHDDLGLPPLHPPIENPDAYSPPRPLLADGRVRFVGEPVAVVVAESAYLAEDAIELVDLTLSSLDVVVDPLTAAEQIELHDGHSNVLYDSRFDSGGVDEALGSAAITFERSFVNPRYSATPMETRGVVAIPEGDGLTVYSSTQAPHGLAAVTAELLGLPRAAVRVRCPDIGGGFGQKAHAYPEEIIVAALALRLGRPMRWIEDRAENLLAASHARDQRVTVRVAADAGGRLLALDADVVCDTGAYGVYPHGHILEALGTPAMIPGPYQLGQYRYRSRSVATNKAPEGAYRGVGLPVSAFVHERLMDILAAEAGIDPAEVRRRNLLGPEQMPHTTLTNQRYDSGDYPRALEEALEAIDYSPGPGRTADGRLRGFGICCYVEYTGINSRVFQGRGMVGIPGEDGAHITIGADGVATLHTTLPAIGQGTATTFAQQLADQLGVSFDRVRIARSDTAIGELKGTGTFASRSAVSGGGAIGLAAAEIRRRLIEDAEELLGLPANELTIESGRVVSANAGDGSIAIDELAASAPPGRYDVARQFDPPAIAYPYATHACEVAIDADTGALDILRYVVVEDCGNVINPLIVDGQIHGATAQGIGGTIYEQLVYSDEGQLITGSLMDYLLPTAVEMPTFEVGHLHTPAPDNELGAKGVGEGGTLAPPGAIAGAVSAALGTEFNRLPISPELVRSAIQGLSLDVLR